MTFGRSFRRSGMTCVFVFTGLILSLPLFADTVAVEDAKHAVSYSPHMQHEGCFMNVGPTGAEAWMRGYQFVVVTLQEGSPAWGKLELGDVIVGANDRMFSEATDHRMDMGNAIGDAERAGEPLKLNVLRQMKPIVVFIDLPPSGGYSATYPMNCPKSRFQLERACEILMDEQMPHGAVPTGGEIGSNGAGLLWLGSNDPRYLEPARRAAYAMLKPDYENIDLNNWFMGYGGMFLAEYYLATGDDTVLPRLQDIVGYLEAGQMVSGSWGHKSPAGGYGALNQPGLVCAIALVLAKECGLEVDPDVLDKALDFFRRFAGLGAVPYGDGFPYRALDDNGKNSIAAILFHLAGESDVARLYGESVADSYWLRERGHTGPYFSIMWGPIAVGVTAPHRLSEFMNYLEWYNNLGTKWDGGMTILPYHEALTRFDANSYIESGNRFSTGGLAWFYTLPMKKLRITGAPHSVFGIHARLSDDVRAARDRYVARDWDAFDAALAAIDPATLQTEDDKNGYAQLTQARAFSKQSMQHTIDTIANNLREGAPYLAKLQLEALTQSLGEIDDPAYLAIQERVNEPSIQWLMRGGKQTTEALEQMESRSNTTWYTESAHLKKQIEAMPTARLPYWKSLSPSSDIIPQTWKSKLYSNEQDVTDGWMQVDFDDRDWIEHEGIFTRYEAEQGQTHPSGPITARRMFVIEVLDALEGGTLRARVQTVRRTLTKVYLNGELIVDLERGKRGGYAVIPLKPSVLDLLKEGENVLAIYSGQQGQNRNHLDVSLEIHLRDIMPAYRPIHRAESLDTRYLPQDVMTDLIVARTTAQYGQAIQDAYNSKSITDLVAAMDNEQGYYRNVAAKALASKGLDAVQVAASKLDDPSWRTRVTALLTLQIALAQFKADQHEAGLALLIEQIPAVTERLADEHFWVRTQSCRLLADYGPDAQSAMPALLEAATDEKEWVRQTAIGALMNMGMQPDSVIAAVTEAVKRENSSSRIARNAVSMAGQAKERPESFGVLLEVIRNPPELAGDVLTRAFDLACELDPDGDVMIPILINVAQNPDTLGNQKGDPRRMAIQQLGEYGSIAMPAVTVLEALLADDTEEGAKYHEPAQTALDAINAG